MIYFIQDTENRRIKIGISSDPIARLKQLQVAQSAELKLVALMDGARAEEDALHQLFTKKRGEWFEPTRELLTFIRERAVSVTSLATASKSRGKYSEWKPELQGDDYLPSLARLIHYIVSTGKGSVPELAAMTYSGYGNMRTHFPSLYPIESLLDYQTEIQRLVDIQDGKRTAA